MSLQPPFVPLPYDAFTLGGALGCESPLFAPFEASAPGGSPPPSRSRSRHSRNTSTNISPITEASAEVPSCYTRTSLTSTLHTPSTALTSYGSFESSPKVVSAPVCAQPEDSAEWFTKFPAEPDLPVDSTDECPDGATVAAVNEIPIYDADGNPRPFRSLYDPQTALYQRQLIIFVRHFFCGACQSYLKAITESITMQDYFTISIPTSIIVIGCGQPHLIRQYRKYSGNFPFSIYADPSRMLFKKLGMKLSLDVGRHRPAYMKDVSVLDWIKGQRTTITRSLADQDGIRKRDVFRGGNPMQIGGEFLFEFGRVIWCHRMTHYRNHAEVSLLRKLLELDG